HALSFAGLVYTSAWIKLHYPAVFLAALLRSQPMGFYSSATLVADARRHGVVTRRPDVARSSVGADLELLDACCEELGSEELETGIDECLHDHDESEIGAFDPNRDDGDHRRDTHFAVRLGLSDVSGIN
ncbi:error-prone DNA polymerase, partial [Escherichia coli]